MRGILLTHRSSWEEDTCSYDHLPDIEFDGRRRFSDAVPRWDYCVLHGSHDIRL